MKKLINKTALLSLLVGILVGCHPPNNPPHTDNEKEGVLSIEKFLSNIPISDVDLNDFPYLKVPKGAKSTNENICENCTFIFYLDSLNKIPVKGRVFSAMLEQDPANNFEITTYYVIKNITDQVSTLGGIKVFEGDVLPPMDESVKDNTTWRLNLKDNSHVSSYLIRRGESNIHISVATNHIPKLQLIVVESKESVH